MKIPTGYRRLDQLESPLDTDRFQNVSGSDGPVPSHVPSYIGRSIVAIGSADNYGEYWQILRKIDSPWISVKERLPRKEDATKHGYIVVRSSNGGVSLHSLNCDWNGINTHWMPLPEPPGPIDPPITIYEGNSRIHELIFNKDGSVKAGCVTLDKEKMDAIVERRKKAMEQ